MTRAIAPATQHIARDILVLRGQRVIIDGDLAALYGVTTKRLNEQVRRNRERFPEDFMFQLTAEEAAAIRSQFATIGRLASVQGWGTSTRRQTRGVTSSSSIRGDTASGLGAPVTQVPSRLPARP